MTDLPSFDKRLLLAQIRTALDSMAAVLKRNMHFEGTSPRDSPYRSAREKDIYIGDTVVRSKSGGEGVVVGYHNGHPMILWPPEEMDLEVFLRTPGPNNPKGVTK